MGQFFKIDDDLVLQGIREAVNGLTHLGDFIFPVHIQALADVTVPQFTHDLH